MRKKKTAVSTKNLITLALYELLVREDYDDITVKDICKKAGVSRMSFYRYYNNKRDIFIDYSDERFAEFYETLLMNKNIDLSDFLIQVFVFFKKYRREILILKKANQQQVLLDQFQSYARYVIAQDHQRLIKFKISNQVPIYFLTGGLFNVLMNWITDGCKESPEEMFKSIAEMSR